jgi:ribosomal protein S8
MLSNSALGGLVSRLNNNRPASLIIVRRQRVYVPVLKFLAVSGFIFFKSVTSYFVIRKNSSCPRLSLSYQSGGDLRQLQNSFSAGVNSTILYLVSTDKGIVSYFEASNRRMGGKFLLRSLT